MLIVYAYTAGVSRTSCHSLGFLILTIISFKAHSYTERITDEKLNEWIFLFTEHGSCVTEHRARGTEATEERWNGTWHWSRSTELGWKISSWANSNFLIESNIFDYAIAWSGMNWKWSVARAPCGVLHLAWKYELNYTSYARNPFHYCINFIKLKLISWGSPRVKVRGQWKLDWESDSKLL